MNKSSPAIQYGLIGGFILGILWIITTVYNLSMLKKMVGEGGPIFNTKTLLIGFLLIICVAIVFVICIVKTISGYKKINPDYAFRDLVMQGLLTTLLLVLLYNGIIYIYSVVISPETIRQTTELAKDIIKNSDVNLDDEQKEKILKSLDNKNPFSQLLSRSGITLVLGMIVSLISATVMNKRNFTNPTQMR